MLKKIFASLVLGATVQLGVALLASEALDLGHRDALHPDARQRLAHFVQLERLDDCRDHLHGLLLGLGPVIRSCT
jgi:hypothetical protein